MRRQKLFLALAMVLSILACERAQDEDKINLSIQLPGLQAQSNSNLGHVVINITGPNMSPIIYTWDRHGTDGTELTAPTSYSFEMTPGSGRLIQVLAVYKSNTDSSSSIYYGDDTKDLRLTTENININVAKITQGESILSGNISGRYLTSAGQGPTGNIDIRYQPPGGKPEMSIEKGYMINGWFNIFALTSISLRYVVSDGTVLWGQPVSLDSSQFSTSSTQISRVSVPVAQRKEYWSGGGYGWMPDEAQIYVFGWFGPAASSEIVCQPQNMTYFSNIVNYNTPGLINSSDPSLGYFLLMNTASFPPTVAQLTDTTASASSYVTAAYGQTSSATCSGYTEFSNKMTLVQSQFDGRGRDGASLFFPPFTKMGSQSSAFATQPSSVGYSISGALLPDLYPNMIDGLQIYKRVVNDSWSYPFEMFSCAAAAAGKAQFAYVTQVNSGGLSSGILPYTLVLASGEESYSGTAVLVCPTKNGNLLDLGFVIKKYNFY